MVEIWLITHDRIFVGPKLVDRVAQKVLQLLHCSVVICRPQPIWWFTFHDQPINRSQEVGHPRIDVVEFSPNDRRPFVFALWRRKSIFVVVVPSTTHGLTVGVDEDVETATLPPVEILHKERPVFAGVFTRPFGVLFSRTQKLIRGCHRDRHGC